MIQKILMAHRVLKATKKPMKFAVKYAIHRVSDYRFQKTSSHQSHQSHQSNLFHLSYGMLMAFDVIQHGMADIKRVKRGLHKHLSKKYTYFQ